MEKKRQVYPQDFKLKIIALLDEGKSTKEISQEFNISTNNINRWYREHKEDLKRERYRKKPFVAESLRTLLLVDANLFSF